MNVEATNAARSPTIPPPSASIPSLRVKSLSAKKSYNSAACSKDLLVSPAGTIERTGSKLACLNWNMIFSAYSGATFVSVITATF